jgi:hypothetical protein
MAKTRGTGLLMLWTDVDPQHEAEFKRWYDEEHLDRLLKVPGVLSAARYEALRGGPRYLAMYELEEASVLRTAAFLDEVRFRPSARRQQSSGGHVGRNYLLNGWRQISPARTNPVYEFARPDVPESLPWNRVRDANPWTRRVRHHMRLDAGSPAVFRRIDPKLGPALEATGR